jgi:RimJ/RimL family protein N-acetyltransferase
MFDYLPIEVENLTQIAAGISPCFEKFELEEGALPPREVASRVIAAMSEGTLPEWCLPYLVIDPTSRKIVGGCGFKGNPREGVVEIGYGIAPSHWRKGIGSSAVAFLVKIARLNPSVEEVTALISPANIASQKLVARLGFLAQGLLADSDGEVLVKWSLRIAI